MPPEDWLVEWKCFPDRPGVNAIIEEDHQSASPVAANRKWIVPPAWTSHAVRGEVEGVDLGLRQIMPSGNITLWLHFWKSRESIDEVLLPSPRHHGAQM
jgi:hypothetical protein